MNRGILDEDWYSKTSTDDLSQFSYKELQKELKKRRENILKSNIDIINSAITALEDIGVKIYSDEACYDYVVKGIEMDEDGDVYCISELND